MDRIRRTERTMIRVRWVGTVFALIQVLTFYRPYPRGFLMPALVLVGLLGLGNVVIWIASVHINGFNAARRLSLASLILDSGVIMGFTFVYTFDPEVAIWALIYVIPLEGAIRFQRRGAFSAMAIAAAAYAVREVYGLKVFGNDLLLTSITFRMGIGFLIAAVAGAMARNLNEDRRRLEETNDLQQSILDALGHLGEGLVIIDRNRVVHANEAAEAITGYSKTELMNLYSLVDLISPDQKAAIVEKMSSFKSNEVRLFETSIIHRTGARVELEIAFQPLEHPENQRLVAIVRDITNRKEAELELRRSGEQLKEAQHVARVGSWEWELSTDQIRWSEEIYRIFECELAELTPEFDSFLFRVHPEDRAAIRDAIGQARGNGAQFEVEFRLMLKEGRIGDFHCRGELKREGHGRVGKVVGIVQDITERKHAERSLERAYEKERETASNLREAEVVRSDFLSTVAHELRTPVTTINGFVRTLEARWQHFEDSRRRDFLSRISKASLKLGRLVDELLDYSRIERGQIALAVISLSLAHEFWSLRDSLSDLLRSHIVEVRIPSQVQVLADQDAVRRIIENLLTNAVKFSHAGSKIVVTAEEKADEIEVSVQDEGVGIPENERERVFERFYRVNRGNTSPPGTGIGLAIVSELVHALGGSVRVVCPPEGGSVFSFTLKKPGLVLTETGDRLTGTSG